MPGIGRTPDLMHQVLNAIEDARGFLEGVRGVLTGFRADVQSIIFTPLRQTNLFLKDIVGVATTLVDFPVDIIRDTKESILELGGFPQFHLIVDRARSNYSAGGAADQAGAAFEKAIANLVGLANDSSKIETTSGRLGTNVQAINVGSTNVDSAHPGHKLFDDPSSNFGLFNAFKPSDLNLRPDTRKKIEAERARVALLQRQDFELMRDQFDQFAADFADFVGAGNSTYTKTYGLPTRTTTRTPTDDEWDTLHTLTNLVQKMDTLCVSTTINRNQTTSMDYVAGLARRSGIAFTQPTSKFAVNFPYGYTLEQLSKQYLKDPDRWHEIAVLNGLRTPYVDETGWVLPMLANGSGNDVTVSDVTDIYVGQKVWLSANNIRREARRVQHIEQSGTFYIVTMDGAPDLSKFSLAAVPTVQGFLPDTVNSQMQIYIPSDSDPTDQDYKVKAIPGVDYFDPLIKAAGIDFLLTYDNDFVITPDGDGRYAVGLTNIVQRARLAISTPRNSLLDHPEYGIGFKPGMSTADLDAKSLLADLKNMFNDSSNIVVQGTSVLKSSNSMFVNMSLGIAGTSQFVPLQVEVKR
jgi:hypothetical protein